MEKEELRENLTTQDTWMRGLYILLFALFYFLAELVLIAVVIFQFFSQLVFGKVNERLLEFGQQLSRYIYDMLRYVTFNSDYKPFPFNPWLTEDSGKAAPQSPAPAIKKKSATKKRVATKKKSAVKKRASTPKPAPAGDKGES